MKVPKGTAPEDFWPQMNMLSTKKSVKTTPGNMSAVFKVVSFHSGPLKPLGTAACAPRMRRHMKTRLRPWASGRE